MIDNNNKNDGGGGDNCLVCESIFYPDPDLVDTKSGRFMCGSIRWKLGRIG